MITSLQDIPNWPEWSLADSPTIFASLAAVPAVEMLDIKLSYWIAISLSYIHTITPNTHVFLRRHTVKTCYDFDLLLSCFDDKSIHIRENIKGEHNYIRQSLKQGQAVPLLPLLPLPSMPHADSDSDIEFIADSRTGSLLKRKWTGSPPRHNEPATQQKHGRPRLAPLIIPTESMTPSTTPYRLCRRHHC
jgi:hypothetical protein